MYRQKKLHEEIQHELNRYEQLHRKLKTEYKFLPQGSLATDVYDNLYRTGRIDGKQYKVLLGDSETSLINKLKKRRYTTKVLKILQKKIENCKAFIENDILYDPRGLEKELSKQYWGLGGIDIFLDGDINEEDWETAAYKSNPFPIKKPNYTPLELCTRSKSEAMIATRLEERNELFRYDAEVVLKNRSVYPDFTIYDKKRRRIIYWEHFGKVDDEAYMLRNLKKLEEYAEVGIILGDNLFITYESEALPLSVKAIDDKLDEILS